MRLFVAITPPEGVVAHLDVFLDVRRESAAFRWAPVEQWHLTLAFCADFPQHRLEELQQRLARAAGKRGPIEASLAGGGAFPNVARARVLWLGLDADQIEVDRLATGARAAVAKSGGHVDGRRFRSHLTLARMSRPIEASSWIRLLDGYAGPAWVIDRIDLIASFLGHGASGRPHYEILGTYPLAD